MAFTETVTIETKIPAAKGGGIADTIKKLERLDALMASVNRQMNGLKNPVEVRTVKDLTADIRKLQGQMGSLSVENLSKGLGKGLGLDAESIRRMVRNASGTLKTELKRGFRVDAEEFTSVPAAARALSQMTRVQSREEKKIRASIGDLLTPQVSAVGGVAVKGMIQLEVPAGQVQASVGPGLIHLNVPAGQVVGGQRSEGSGQRSAGGRDPATGRFTGGGGGGGGRGGGGGGSRAPGPGDGGYKFPESLNELERTRVTAGNKVRETVKVVDDIGRFVNITYSDLGEILRTSKRTATGSNLRQQIANRLRLEQEAFKAAKAAIPAGRPGALATLLEKQASQLEGILTEQLKAELGAKKYQGLQQKIEARAGTLRSQAAGLRGQLGMEQLDFLVHPDQMWRDQEAYNRKIEGQRARRTVNGVLYGSDREANEARGMRKRNQERMDQARAAAGTPPPLPAQPPSPQGFTQGLTSGQRGFSAFGMGRNLAHAAGWAIPATALYKSVQLVNYSLGRMIDIGSQTARLSQVFRGVGGSAEELTDDVLRLAAAQGQSTAEAMESAISWSRAGLTRKEVNMAVRDSLVAANIAELSAGQATEYLSSVMAGYGLRVSELNGFLGQLNDTSNKMKVSNKDLLEGMARSSAVARQSGISFSELQAHIGAMVKGSGRTGANVGNAIKSILVSLNRPEIQEFLRAQGVEPTRDGGKELKSGGQILRETYVAYQGMSSKERGRVVDRIAGKTQANLLTTYFETYVEAEQKAIESQLNLNSAENENIRITAELKSQMAGLRAEFDRLVVTQANAKSGFLGGLSPKTFLTEGTEAVTSILKVQSLLAGKVSPRGTSGSLPSLMGLPGLGVLNQVFKLIDGLDNWLDPLPGKLKSAGTEIFALGEEAAAATRKADLLRTVSQALGQQALPRQLQEVGGLSQITLEKVDKNRLITLLQQNKLTEARAVLEAAAVAAEGQSLGLRQRELAARDAAVGILQKELDLVRSKGGDLEREAALQTGINQLMAQRAALAKTLGDETEQYLETTKEHYTILAKTRMELERVADLFAQMPSSGTAVGQLGNRLLAMGMQEKVMTEGIGAAEAGGLSGEEILKLSMARQQHRAEMAAAEASRSLAGLFDDRSVAFRRAGEESEAAGFGRNRAEQLLNRERFLKEQMSAVRGQRSDNEVARLLQMEVDLLRTKEEIQRRITQLKGEEKQILLETNREFQRSLITAGPGDLLKKLAAHTFHRRGNLDAGQFFGLAPDVRGDVDALRGGQAMRGNREERARLRGREQTVEVEQAERVAAGKRIAGWQEELTPERAAARKAEAEAEAKRLAAAAEAKRLAAVEAKRLAAVEAEYEQWQIKEVEEEMAQSAARGRFGPAQRGVEERAWRNVPNEMADAPLRDAQLRARAFGSVSPDELTARAQVAVEAGRMASVFAGTAGSVESFQQVIDQAVTAITWSIQGLPAGVPVHTLPQAKGRALGEAPASLGQKD